MNRGLKPVILAFCQACCLVTNLDPMNRGLKLDTDLIGFLQFFMVTNLDPMNRGLKLSNEDPSPLVTISYKPRPDE